MRAAACHVVHGSSVKRRNAEALGPWRLNANDRNAEMIQAVSMKRQIVESTKAWNNEKRKG